MLKSMSGALLTLMVAAAAVHAIPDRRRDLTAHEWGTFTSVAGEDGRAVAWRPLDGPADLPCFVERADLPPKFSFMTTVRMETPVIYFYAPEALTVDVSVGFRRGLITEFFPHAAPEHERLPRLLRREYMDRLAWRDVQIRPGAGADFPVESSPNHYYAARAATAAPLQVGEQKEGFLFYRGVGGFELPLRATVSAAQDIELVNHGPDSIPAAMLFENRQGQVGYRTRTGVTGALTLPAADLDSDITAVRAALVGMLIGEGLYPREADAMVSTWSDSWFEEGTRLFYVVPKRLVDETLPLEIRPAPANVVRVFVGRLEIAAAATLADLRDALLSNDAARIARHGRFAEPFSQRLLAGDLAPAERARIHAALSSAAKTAQAAFQSPSNRCDPT